ncbi:MAG TPA: hypothetical protein P5181_01580 [Dermatophilaceae bacterium]|nr:hypothetical protein [Dermatophilaceae bacterium]
MKKFWNVFRWFLLAFLIYAIIKSPDQAADILRTLFQLLRDAFVGIISVFDALLGRR